LERINLSEAISSLVEFIKENEKDDGLRFRPKPNPFGENGICVAL